MHESEALRGALQEAREAVLKAEADAAGGLRCAGSNCFHADAAASVASPKTPCCARTLHRFSCERTALLKNSCLCSQTA
jgi:D-serine deaminase-like pyridoxal phosphate-dependent protein